MHRVYAAYGQPALAERAVAALKATGFSGEDLSLVGSRDYVEDRRHRRLAARAGPEPLTRKADHEDVHLATRLEQPTPAEVELEEEAGIMNSALTGATVGLLLSFISGVGLLFVPNPIGIPAVLAGWALGGTAVATFGGAMAGGMLGRLRGAGVPESVVWSYQDTIDCGGCIVIVECSRERDERLAQTILAESGGSNVVAFGGPVLVQAI